MTSRRRLPRAARIRDEDSVRALRRAGRVRGRWFIVAAMPNEIGQSRLAVRVAKKVVKSAVARNRIRRCVKEVFRQLRAQFPPTDFLVSLVHPYGEPTFQPGRQELARLLTQAARR